MGPLGGHETVNIGVVSHLIAVLAYSGLATLLMLSLRWHILTLLLLVAVVTTIGWAGLTACAFEFGGGWHVLADLSEIARSGAWLAFLAALTAHYRGGRRRSILWGVGITAVAVVALVNDLWIQPRTGPLGLVYDVSNVGLAARLTLAILGLMLIEDLYRNTPQESRWSVKFFVIGLGGIFAYEFFFYANTVLVHARDPDYLTARGLVDALAAPLIAVGAARCRDWAPPIHVSRQVTYHSATALASGLYLVCMAAAGYYVQRIGGTWGGVLQIAFLFGAIFVLAVILASGRARAWAKTSIARHFYSYGYDYREEWLRFMRTLSMDDGGIALGERIVRAIADIFEVPGGQLWLLRDEVFQGRAAWNMAVSENEEPSDSPFTRLLHERREVFEIAAGKDAGLPAWLCDLANAWIVLPLLHHDRLLGFMVLQRPRAPRRLTEEDRALLLTVGRQAASYLAEWSSAQALLQAKLFDTFTQRAAFVVHDLKNLVSQLSILVSNAERHRDNPDFVSDMVATIRDSISKMEGLLVRLGPTWTSETDIPGRISVGSILRQVLERPGVAGPCPEIERCDPDVLVLADQNRFAAAIHNLVQNAAEAAGPNGRVVVRVDREGKDAVIAIEDDGPGMDPAFIRDGLFQPFRSTKGRGFGLGAFESREFARRAGGRLEVDSLPQRGTIMRLILPAVPDTQAEETS